MQSYELTYIVDAEQAEDKREKIVEKVKNLIVSNKAEPGQLEVWGKRDFTFPIAKKNAGVYYLQYFTADTQSIAPIEKRLKIDTDIIRYLLVAQKTRKIKKVQPRGLKSAS